MGFGKPGHGLGFYAAAHNGQTAGDISTKQLGTVLKCLAESHQAPGKALMSPRLQTGRTRALQDEKTG